MSLVVERCPECDQLLPQRPTHVYAVKVRLGSGAVKWLYSEPTDHKTAQREATYLRATGHVVSVLTVYEAAQERAKREAKRGTRRSRGAR